MTTRRRPPVVKICWNGRRGRLGTVLTSFRGLLNDGVSGVRKTLLGE